MHSTRNNRNVILDYLLSLLQNAFLKARLDSRRSYRDLIDRRNALKSEGRQAGSNKQFLANFSSMLKPPFERSMMTMSFLMFGVFVVQVVQVNPTYTQIKLPPP
jgi:hypothetical protein